MPGGVQNQRALSTDNNHNLFNMDSSSGNIHKKKNHIIDDEHINITVDDENDNANGDGVAPSSSGGVEFHNVEALTRGGGAADDDNSNNNNSGSHHKKSSQELNYYGDSDNSATDGNEGGHSLAGYSLRDGGNNNAGTTGTTSFIHSKSSDSTNNFTPPTQHPTPKPTHLFANSLREWHQPKSSDPSEGYTLTHSKVSQEKNAQNQNVVNYQWSTDSPTRMPTTTEVNGVQAVARAQDDYDEAHNNNSNSAGGGGGGSSGGGVCKADENGAFFNGLQVRNGGAVLRYQYELIQENIDNDDTNNSSVEDDVVDELLRKEIIPRLEGGITNALIPIFFEECLNSKQNVEGRALLLSDGIDDGGSLRHRRLNKVVGIDAKPNDFPLVRSECKSEPLPNSKCHRVEGALTLYFPPNYTLSTLLSSAALSTLRAIEQGMNDGSLATSHEDIRKLHFLQSSYDLQPKPIPYDGIDSVNVQDDGGAKEGGNNLGLILGILLPLLFILGCCCCCAGVYYWKKRQYPDNAHDEHDYEVSNSSTEASIMNAKLQRNHEEESDTDVEEATDQDDTTDDDDRGTTTSDSEDDNSTDGSTSSRSKSATSDSNSDSDTSNSHEDSEEEERDFFPVNPLDPIFEEAERERARKKKMKRRHARIKRRYERMNRNKNIVMTGDDHNNKAECDDNMSVMTGATGMHSVSSVATSRIKNNNIGR